MLSVHPPKLLPHMETSISHIALATLPKKSGKEISKICGCPLVCHFAFQLSTLLQSLKTVINFQPETSEHSKIQKKTTETSKILSLHLQKDHKRSDAIFQQLWISMYFATKAFVFFLGFGVTIVASKAFSEASDVPRPLGLAASKRGSWDRLPPHKTSAMFAKNAKNQRPKMPKNCGIFQEMIIVSWFIYSKLKVQSFLVTVKPHNDSPCSSPFDDVFKSCLALEDKPGPSCDKTVDQLINLDIAIRRYGDISTLTLESIGFLNWKGWL